MALREGQEVYHKETLKTGIVLPATQVTRGGTIQQALTKVLQANLITKVRWDSGDIGYVNTEDLQVMELQLVLD